MSDTRVERLEDPRGARPPVTLVLHHARVIFIRLCSPASKAQVQRIPNTQRYHVHSSAIYNGSDGNGCGSSSFSVPLTHYCTNQCGHCRDNGRGRLSRLPSDGPLQVWRILQVSTSAQRTKRRWYESAVRPH